MNKSFLTSGPDQSQLKLPLTYSINDIENVCKNFLSVV